MSEITVSDLNIQRCTHDRDNPYLMLSVAVTRDPRLSVEELGFITVLLDHPNNFKFNVSYLVKRCRLSREKTRKLLNRLAELGYVMANQIRERGKFLATVYRVFEKPLKLVKDNSIESGTTACKTVSGKTVSGYLDTNKYDTEVNNIKKNTNVCMLEKNLKILMLDISNEHFKNAQLIRGCEPIKDQDLLNAYLSEFNKKADLYAHLSEIERINNFAVFVKRCGQNSAVNEKKQATSKNTGRSIRQISYFAQSLCNDPEFARAHAAWSGETLNAYVGRIRRNLMKAELYEAYKPYLIGIGLISTS